MNEIDKSILINNKDNIFHSYLIEMDDFILHKKEIYDFLEYLLSAENDIKLKYLIENEIYPEIVYIRPINNIIKKNQLLELQRKFNEKPVLGKFLIYIIEGAEYLNSSSANTILKFLEEPEENIVALLLTKNKYNVIDTIVSRCQNINIYNRNNNIVQEHEESLNILNTIDKYKSNSIALLGYLYSSKNLCFEYVDGLINDFINIYRKVLCDLVSKDNTDDRYIEIINANSVFSINEKLFVLIELKENLKCNVNIKMFLDMLILRMAEVKND